MRKLAMVVFTLVLVGSPPASADVFDDHMTILCRSLQTPADLERIEGLLKTPYILKGFVFPNGDPRYPNCGTKSPLFLALKLGPPESVDRLLQAGFSKLAGSDTAQSTGTPVTYAQVTLFLSVFG